MDPWVLDGEVHATSDSDSAHGEFERGNMARTSSDSWAHYSASQYSVSANSGCRGHQIDSRIVSHGMDASRCEKLRRLSSRILYQKYNLARSEKDDEFPESCLPR